MKMKINLLKEREGNMSPEEMGIAPQTPEEKEVLKEIEKMPEDKKKSLFAGLSAMGLNIEEKKNNFLAKAFDEAMSRGTKVFGYKTKGLDEKSTAGRFFKELRNSFVRDAEIAKQKKEAVLNGKEKHIRSSMGGFANIVKYGRVITDLTGKSLVSPLRYVMMGGMAFTQASEAAIEARLKNEEVIEKTRIKDADLAAEKAWKIYKRAQEGANRASAQELKDAYLANIPQDINDRLQNPSTGNKFIQKVIKDDLISGMQNIVNYLNEINGNKKLSVVERKEAEKKILKKYEKNLVDYDRILTQYGTVVKLLEKLLLLRLQWKQYFYQ